MGFRYLLDMKEPAFQLIVDRDILIDHEIADEYSFDFVAANALLLRAKEGCVCGHPTHDMGGMVGPGQGNGNGSGQRIMGMGEMAVIGELHGSERVVTSGGEDTDAIEGLEEYEGSDASSN